MIERCFHIALLTLFHSVKAQKSVSRFATPSILHTTPIRFYLKGTSAMTEALQGKSNSPSEQRQDPIVAEEIEGKSIPQASSKASTAKRTNACTFSQEISKIETSSDSAVTELMSAKKPKPAPKPAEAPAKPVKRGFDARNGLGMYIEHPEKNPEGLVVEYDDDFVVINDKFPKARYAPTDITQCSFV